MCVLWHNIDMFLEILFFSTAVILSLFFVSVWSQLRSEEISFALFYHPEESFAVTTFSLVGTEFFFIFILFPIFFWLNRRELGLRITICWLIAGAVILFFRELTELPRPDFEELDDRMKAGYSFPSGHIVQVILVLGYVSIYLKSNYFFLLTALLTVLIGISRLILGHHYLDDVVAGVIIGIFTLHITVKFIDFISRKKISLSYLFLTPLLLSLPLLLIFIPHHLLRHLYILFFLLGILIGYVIVEEIKMKLPSFKTKRGYTYYIALGIMVLFSWAPYLLIENNVKNSFLFFFYFFTGMFITLLWPYIFNKLKAFVDNY